MDLLSQIKRMILRGAYVFTFKARAESELDGLAEEDVIEAIVNASQFRSKRSTSPKRAAPREMVHIILGFTFDGILVYTKGVIRREEKRDVFYVLVSAKKSTLGNQE